MFSEFAGQAQLHDICKTLNYFSLSSVQTGCLSAFSASFGMFSKFAASTLGLYLQRDNISLLNENYNYQSEQKGWS